MTEYTPDNNYNISSRIKEIRGSLTQLEFAKKIGFSRSYVADVEKGRTDPSRKMIIAICESFNVSSDWILRGKEHHINASKEAKKESQKALIKKAKTIYEKLGEVLESLDDK